MTVIMFAEAEADLEQAFDHYESQDLGLGVEMLDEFRRGVAHIVPQPAAWRPLDPIRQMGDHGCYASRQNLPQEILRGDRSTLPAPVLPRGRPSICHNSSRHNILHACLLLQRQAINHRHRCGKSFGLGTHR